MDNVVGKMLEGRYLIENLIGVGGNGQRLPRL